jgi:murein DD-endopeptidase MepM/ murein hydrolase activator NlpD
MSAAMNTHAPSFPVLLAGVAVLVLILPASSVAAEAGPPAPAPAASVTTAPAPAPEAPPASTPTVEIRVPPPPPPRVAHSPRIRAQHSQGSTPGGSSALGLGRPKATAPNGAAGEERGSAADELRAKQLAPSPSGLTPALPFALQSAIGGVPGFFIESFRIPPFLMPIYQAAGTAYDIPWPVLAAINEVETDYGRDLSVSSAGAEGWMQFLPVEWSQYGVDANGDGYKDPYNPADAIFAAARYLSAAGGARNIRSAVFSYNHAQPYVDSVMLRAQLLGGTPPELLGAITALTEARFPVHAAAHFSDGFPVLTSKGSSTTRTLPGTTIYSQAGAPVIAVQDGEVVGAGDSPTLGHFVSLRDAFGNTYTYAQLGDVSSVYPVLQPHVHTTVSRRIGQPGARPEPAPSGPATAGAQPRSPVSESATVSTLALGAAAALEAAPAAPTHPSAPAVPAPAPPNVRAFTEGSNDVYLHTLRAGVQVIAGTVLGHVGAGAPGADAGEPHIVFQVRPAGPGAPEIDPKPILDGWVALENTSIFRAKGENPFLATSPAVGQVLLESKQQLEPQVLHDGGIGLGRCGREAVQAGRVDKRVLAMLEYLSVSGLKPTVSGLSCAQSTAAASASNAAPSASNDAVSITAINGVPVVHHQGPGSIADSALRRLLMLQGASRPQRIDSLMSYPGTPIAVASPRAADAIRVAFSSTAGASAHVATQPGSALTPAGWLKLIARLGEIPDPTVGRAPSAASIPDAPGSSPGGEGRQSGGNG